MKMEKPKESSESLNFDTILSRIKPLGRYQALHIILTGFAAFPVGAFNMANVFLSDIPNYWCADMIKNDTNYGTEVNKSLLNEWDRNFNPCNFGYDYQINYNKSMDHTLQSSDGTERTCSKWDFDKRFYESTVATEWDMVCSSEWLVSLSQTTYMLGFLLGAVTFGVVSDRFGRKKAWMSSILLMICSGTMSAFMPNFWSFIGMRTISGFAASGTLTSGFVIKKTIFAQWKPIKLSCFYKIAMEVLGIDCRMKIGIFYQCWFAAGYMVMAFAAYFLRDFRHLSLLIALVPVISIPSFWFLDESGRWLLAERKIDQACEVIKRASRINQASYPDDLISRIKQTEDDIETDDLTSGTALDLFRTPNMRKNTLITCYVWFVVSIIYYGLSYGVGGLTGGPYINLFLSGATEFPAMFLAVILLDKIGRRWPLSLSLFIPSFCCLGMAAIPKEYNVVLIILSMLGKGTISGGFAIIFVYSAELFPTVVRTVGVGIGSMCARIAALLAPFVALLGNYSLPLPYILFGTLTVIGGVLTLMLPETLHQCLPETVEDGEHFGQNSQGILKTCMKCNRNSKDYEVELSNEDLKEKETVLL